MRGAVGEILAELGGLTLSTLRSASDWQRVHGGTIERALLQTGAVTEDALTAALSKASGLATVSRETLLSASPEVVGALPSEARRRLRAIPFARVGTALRIAVSRPTNPVLETGLIATTGSEVALEVVCEPVLEDCLDHWDRAEGVVPSAEDDPPDLPGHDPFEKLGRALFSEALHQESTSLELGLDAKGGFALSSRPDRPPMKRRLPGSVMPQLISWLEMRRGHLTIDWSSLEDIPRRYDVEMARTISGGMKLTFVLLPDAAVRIAAAGETEPSDADPSVAVASIAVASIAEASIPAAALARPPGPAPAPEPALQQGAAPKKPTWRCTHVDASPGDVFCPRCGDLV